MSTVRRRAVAMLVALLAVATLAAGTSPRVARADDPNVNAAVAQQRQIESQLAQQRQQLQDLRRQQADLTDSLAQLASDLDAVGLQVANARAEFDRLSTQLQQARSDLRQYELQIDHLAANLVALSQEIDSARTELVGREALLQDHLRAAYQQSQTSILEVLLSTESFGEASSQLSYQLSLSDEDIALATEIRDARDRLQVRQQTLREGAASLADLRTYQSQRVAALDEQQKALDAARKVLAAKEKQLKDMQAQQELQLADAHQQQLATEAAMQEAQAELAGQEQLVASLKEQANALDVAYHGRFAWPEVGDFVVTQEFGRTPFNPWHTGLDMSYVSPHCGGPIYAAADGVVLADGRPNLQYGDTAIGVVIGHSQRLQTWYWHMSQEIVDVGQQVHTGDLIGYEGATGIATGCHLHFQVMLDGVPQNPRLYLP
jgi:murein DD-endopeptidase MepM/ murein hydrolase activator NlpD